MEWRIGWAAGLALALFLAGAARAEDAPPAEEVKAAKARLEEAWRGEDEQAMVEAVESAAGLGDPGVIDLVAKGMRTKRRAVIEASIAALGATNHPDALKALLRMAETARTKDLSGYEDLFAQLLREIGRSGDPKGIEALTEKPYHNLTYSVGVARIMGLSRIRTRDAIEALIELSRLSGGRGGKTGAISVDREQYRPAFRTAMAVLTGRDEGLVPADWEKWWRNHGKGFEVPAERPKVPDDVRRAWETYWGERYYAEGAAPPPPRVGSPITRVEKPTPEQVKEAVEALKLAFKIKEYDQIVAALNAYGGVLHEKVVHEVARGLRSTNQATRIASIDTLGWMKYPPALRQLHREYRRGRTEWTKNEDVFAHVLQAIGRHGDKSSIEVLADDPFRGLTIATGRARIFGLGNIRDKKSIEEVIKGTQLAGSNTPRSWKPVADQRFLREFYAALIVLTGEDLGSDLEAWRQWWRKAKGTYKIPKDRPAVPAWVSQWWTTYWGEAYETPSEGGGR
jgi:HEAT repeat protein